MSGSELKESLDLSAFAMSKEEMRPAMMGVLLKFSDEGLRLVATDGHRLVNILKKSFQTDIIDQYIVPERAITVILKILDEKEVNILKDLINKQIENGILEKETRVTALA